MILYRSIGLSAREAAEIMTDIVELIYKKKSDEEILRFLTKKYAGMKLSFASLTLGRIVGMSFAIKDRERAKGILTDIKRYMDMLKLNGKEELIKVIEREILEETYKDVEKLKDAF